MVVFRISLLTDFDHLFHMFIGHVVFLFYKVPVSISYPFFF